jgi:hypothetical protein
LQVLEEHEVKEVTEDAEVEEEIGNTSEAEQELRKERIRKDLKRRQKAKTQEVLKHVNSKPFITKVEVIDSYEGHGQDTCHLCDMTGTEVLPMIQLHLTDKKKKYITICHDCFKKMNKLLYNKKSMIDTKRKIDATLGTRQRDWNKHCQISVSYEERQVMLEDSIEI